MYACSMNEHHFKLHVNRIDRHSLVDPAQNYAFIKLMPVHDEALSLIYFIATGCKICT